MRMGFVIPRSTVGKNLGTYRGLPKIYQGFGARDSRLLPWRHITKFEETPFQIFTGVPVT